MFWGADAAAAAAAAVKENAELYTEIKRLR